MRFKAKGNLIIKKLQPVQKNFVIPAGMPESRAMDGI